MEHSESEFARNPHFVKYHTGIHCLAAGQWTVTFISTLPTLTFGRLGHLFLQSQNSFAEKDQWVNYSFSGVSH